MVGSSKLDGVLLPASPGAKGGAVFAFYAVMVISATGIETFNLAMHIVLGHLVRWALGYTRSGYDTMSYR